LWHFPAEAKNCLRTSQLPLAKIGLAPRDRRFFISLPEADVCQFFERKANARM
jgi:hypothetical protein